MKTRELMQPVGAVVDLGAAAAEATALLGRATAGLLPVLANGRLVGLLTEADLAGAAGSQAKVADLMRPEVRFCFDDEDAAQARASMRAEGLSALPVLDHTGALVGILAP